MAEQAPPTPKMDLKMIVFPLMFMLNRQIDMKNPDIVHKARMGLFTVCFMAMASYFLVYQKVTTKKDKTVIWVPPKAVPALPFGPQPEPPKSEDFVATTYMDHEIKLLYEALQALVVSVGIALFMSFKFDIHMSCTMNCVMIPLGLYENILIKTYLLGMKEDNQYNEVFTDPTATTEPPRVEELDDDGNKELKTNGDDEDNEESKSSVNGEVSEDTSEGTDEDAVKIEKSDADDID